MSALGSSLGIVAYMALFCCVGLIFLFANLLLGYFLRPKDPHPEKLEIYECGEPTIGSSFVQFDLRFYVVALLFIIFDVEVAFFFPWAAAFGKAMHMERQAELDRMVVAADDGAPVLSAMGKQMYREFGVHDAKAPTAYPASLKSKTGSTNSAAIAKDVIRDGSKQFAWVTIVDILVFFGVLLVGFAYVWRRGDLDWVRAVSRERVRTGTRGAGIEVGQEQVLSV